MGRGRDPPHAAAAWAATRRSEGAAWAAGATPRPAAAARAAVWVAAWVHHLRWGVRYVHSWHQPLDGGSGIGRGGMETDYRAFSNSIFIFI